MTQENDTKAQGDEKPVEEKRTLLDGIESRAVIAVLTEPIPYQLPWQYQHRWSNYGGMEVPQAGQDY